MKHSTDHPEKYFHIHKETMPDGNTILVGTLSITGNLIPYHRDINLCVKKLEKILSKAMKRIIKQYEGKNE